MKQPILSCTPAIVVSTLVCTYSVT